MIPTVISALGMANQTHTGPAPLNFKAAFCEAFGCPEDAFQEALFQKCLLPRSRPLVSLIRLISPDFFRDDLDYLERVGRATTWPGFWTLANRIPYYFVWNHGLRKRLHLRISGARLIKIYEEVAERRRQSLL